MKSRVQTILVLLVLLFTLALTSCVVFGNQLDSQDSKVINQQIRDAIEKTIPLPENAAIRTHIGDEITFSSELSVGQGRRILPGRLQPERLPGGRRPDPGRSIHPALQ